MGVDNGLSLRWPDQPSFGWPEAPKTLIFADRTVSSFSRLSHFTRTRTVLLCLLRFNDLTPNDFNSVG